MGRLWVSRQTFCTGLILSSLSILRVAKAHFRAEIMTHVVVVTFIPTVICSSSGSALYELVNGDMLHNLCQCQLSRLGPLLGDPQECIHLALWFTPWAIGP